MMKVAQAVAYGPYRQKGHSKANLLRRFQKNIRAANFTRLQEYQRVRRNRSFLLPINWRVEHQGGY